MERRRKEGRNVKRRKPLSTLSKVNALLSKMLNEREVGSLDEGEEYICPTCNLPVKPCEEHSGNTCPVMIKGETEMAHLEQIESKLTRGESVRCINCGSAIPMRQLERNPLREVCGSCSATASRSGAAR